MTARERAQAVCVDGFNGVGHMIDRVEAAILAAEVAAAEAMRERCALVVIGDPYGASKEAVDCATNIRAIPLSGGS